MATLVQTDGPAGSGTLQPLLLFVSGAVHAFRAMDRWREATNAAAVQRATAHAIGSIKVLENHHLDRPRRPQHQRQWPPQQQPPLQPQLQQQEHDPSRSLHPPAHQPSYLAGDRPLPADARHLQDLAGPYVPSPRAGPGYKSQQNRQSANCKPKAGAAHVQAPVWALQLDNLSEDSTYCCSSSTEESSSSPLSLISNWDVVAAQHAAGLVESGAWFFPRAAAGSGSGSRLSFLQRNAAVAAPAAADFTAAPSTAGSSSSPTCGHIQLPSTASTAAAGAGLANQLLQPPPPQLPAQQQRQEEQQQQGAAVVMGQKAIKDMRNAEWESPPSLLQAVTVLAGAVSRTAAQVAIHPLDTLKTRMQVRLPTPQLCVWRAVMSSPATRPRALAAWAGVAGARDLLLGLGASVAGVLPSSALYFTLEHRIRNWLGDVLGADRDSPVSRLTASAAAATMSALIRVPADVVKHRLQAYAFRNASHAVRAIFATHGLAGLYAGFRATLLRDVPEIVIQFTIYRQLKALMEQQHSGGVAVGGAMLAVGPSEHMLLGGAAGAAAALATTPLDVIKTQLQCGSAASVSAAAAEVLRAGGPAALFGGLVPRVLQATLCSALFFTCFEASKAHLNDIAGVRAAATVAVPQAAPPPPPAATVWDAVTARGATPPGWLLSLPPPRQRRSPWRRGLDDGGGAASGANFWASCGPWGNESMLTPVALYAYAYAGATAPAAAAAAAATATATAPIGFGFQAR